ncbi:MAG: helix-turn-helix transcriptional regulator [Ruminococcaceae bacterium]|nr:helix-turn-helix transcriptional regulator [Oscillospiraceae bacterium]
MEYMGTEMRDALSVKEIFTVLRPKISETYPGRGEAHPFPEIFYLSKGHHILLLDKEEYALSAGDMIIYAPNSFHEASRHRPLLAEAAVLTFEAESDILSSLYNRVITLSQRQRSMLDAMIDEGMRYFCGRPLGDPISGMVLRPDVSPTELWGLKKQIELFLIDVYRLQGEKASESRKEAKWDSEFSSAVRFLQENLTAHLTLEQIARGCSMSVSKLKLLFRSKAGMGPIDYLIRLRIERAQILIDEGKLNLTQISEELGFTSLHYFSRLFKHITGLSPSEYAKNR